ncbi:DUF4132 domain-containing protein [Amycolatopsis sp. cmx-4-68]|uniref:DUF4132 domain-containing protein n=1 Tax=Amycolatopsis sp. cmx-4-68 TaxID=2790938 RepID=UPI00397818AA
MPGEHRIDIPDTWRHAVHPRRGGMAALEPLDVKHESLAELTAWHAARGVDLDGKREGILDHAETDPALRALALSAEPSVEADGVRLALAPNPSRGAIAHSASMAPIDDLAAVRGPAHAAAAFVASCAYYTADRVSASDVTPLLRHSDATDAGYPVWTDAARQLRSMLAVARQDVYDDTVARLAALRGGLLRQRIVTSYLVPARPEWAAADLDDLPGGYWGSPELLFYSMATVEQLSRWHMTSLEQFVTAFDAAGEDVVPLLFRQLDRSRWAPDVRRDVLEVLTRIPTDAAFGGLLHRMDLPAVPGGVRAAADRFPRRAARLLGAHRDGDFVDVLLLRHVRRHPEVPEAQLFTRRPEAPPGAVPKLLASPPWDREPPARITVAPVAVEPRIVWQDGEQERWADDWRAFRSEEMRGHLPLAEKGVAPPEFYIRAPGDIVRPLLARWQAESASFYLEKPQVVVAKYELAALAPFLRLAHKKPVVGAPLLMPYLAVEVAELMAGWLTRSRRFRPVAREWFTRHGAGAAALLIPAALGAARAEATTAALALSRLDADDVRAAAKDLGCVEAVETLLSRDPLDFVPAKIPAVPKWADPGQLPQVLLAGGEYALPAEPTTALLRMIAMSQLDAPYEGLRVIAGHCDPASLSAFAWSLYRLWEAEDRPSKDAWAMDALGYFGDDTVADRLAPRIRAWPSEGAAPRAKRGADVLAVMNTERALGHLSALARNAKSGPLRRHAAAALDRVAADRGLLPEQLDDLLAPDLGLDGAQVEYRNVSYAVDLGDTRELVLRDPSGARLSALPKAANDEEKATASAWNSLRRKAKPLIADQVARLEEAMVVQRRWSGGDFRSRIVAHPLLGRFARGLVWALDDRTAAVDALGDPVDPAGGLLGDGTWVRLAHPAVDDFTPWAAWLAQRGEQPFAQAGREVFTGEDPSVYWQRTVAAAKLSGLVRRGWQWAPSGHKAVRHQLFRPFGPEGRVALTIDPGTSAVADPKAEPAQTITEITFESAAGELGVFSDLPLVTRSELIRSLRSLDARER